MTSLNIWRNWAYDVVEHMMSLSIWRHWAYDFIEHMTSLSIWRHWAYDVIENITSYSGSSKRESGTAIRSFMCHRSLPMFGTKSELTGYKYHLNMHLNYACLPSELCAWTLPMSVIWTLRLNSARVCHLNFTSELCRKPPWRFTNLPNIWRWFQQELNYGIW